MKFMLIILSALAILNCTTNADIDAGKSAYAARGCIGCHGVNGESVIPTNPALKGRDAAFITKSLTGFRSGERDSLIMNGIAAGLSDEDIKNLADYIDSLK